MSKKIEIEIPEGKVAEWKEINGVTTLVLTDEKDNRPVTERIKTFEDAMMATGMTLPLDENKLSYLPKDVVAYMKLRIIAAALNELHEATLDEFPKFATDEYRWYPWFYLYTQEEIDKMDDEEKKISGGSAVAWYSGSDCGLAYASSVYAGSTSAAYISARLAVKSEALANYFGQQFLDIWADYVALPRKKDE